MHLTNNSRRNLILFFISYLLLLSYFILVKNPVFFIQQLSDIRWEKIKSESRHVSLTPFKTTAWYLKGKMGFWIAVENIGGNFFGFVPLGIFFPLLFSKCRKVFITILATFLLSLFFETFQLITIVGHFDIDDLILNTLGGAAGFLTFKLLLK